MSDTPRTDALLERMDRNKYDDRTGSLVLIAHAHELEAEIERLQRELAEALKKASDADFEKEEFRRRLRSALDRAKSHGVAAACAYHPAARVVGAEEYAQVAEDAERMREALRELVRLKDMKDGRMDYDDTVEYQSAKPRAWEAARAALAHPDAPKEGK